MIDVQFTSEVMFSLMFLNYSKSSGCIFVNLCGRGRP